METFKKIWKNLNRHSRSLEKAKTITQVAIFGFADSKPKDKLYKEAYQVAYVLAKAGYTVVDGGGPGVMEAASRGAKTASGKVIGVTFYPTDTDNFEGRDINNPVDEEIKTKSYVERTLTLLREGQVYVIFNGASGTLSEFAMAWGLARIYFGHHKPIILYGKFWREITNVLKKNLMLRPGETRVYKIVETPEQMLHAINEFEKEIERGEHKHLKTTMKEGGDYTV
ncbi:MAG: LOG family protein [Candidatus Daviesbacteria bacterium]|nr:LOG family protein [Candidatus Daviesbacteria bacterium]